MVEKIFDINPARLLRIQSLKSRSANVEVVFGAPSLDCDGFGICRIDVIPFATIEKSLSDCTCRLNIGRGKLIFHRENWMMLRLNKDSIHPDTIKKQFSKVYFKIAETYAVDAKAIWKDVAVNQKLIFNAGKHLLFEDRKHIIIIFSSR